MKMQFSYKSVRKFMEGKERPDMAKNIQRQLKKYPKSKLKNGARNWFLISMLKENDLLDEYVAQCWPAGKTEKGLKKIEKYKLAAEQLTNGKEIIAAIATESAGENNDIYELTEEEQPLEIKLEQRQIFADTSEPTIDGLHKRYQKGKLILSPEFQRFHVWDKTTSSRLIESVLIDVPIPVVYLAEEDDGKCSVIDGQQRLRAFFDYLENRFKLQNMLVLKELNNKLYKDLVEPQQDKIEETKIYTVKIRKESDKNIRFEIFERLNRGSVKLNDQELRNCIYRGEYNNTINDLAQNKDFLWLIGLKSPHKRMFDRELVLRFLAMYHNAYLNYSPPMKQFMNTDMEEYRDIDEKPKKKAVEVFKKAVMVVKTVFGDKAFRRFTVGTEKDPNGHWEKKRVNQALFDVLMFGFTPYDQNQIIPHSDAIREELIWLMTHDQEFIEAITVGTSDKTRVFSRFEKWLHSLKEIIGVPKTEVRNFTLNLKEELFKANPTCAICGQRIHGIDDSEVDHIKHYWRGGKTIPDNARLTHRYCNRARGGRE